MNKIQKNYGKLTNTERLILLLEAVKRDDFVDLDNLQKTAPKKNYSMSDAWLTDRYDAAKMISLVYAVMRLQLERDLWITVGTSLAKEDKTQEERALFETEDFLAQLVTLEDCVDSFSIKVGLQKSQLLAFIEPFFKISKTEDNSLFQNRGQLIRGVRELEEYQGWFDGFWEVLVSYWPDEL